MKYVGKSATGGSVYKATRASDLSVGQKVEHVSGKTGTVQAIDSDGYQAKVKWDDGKIEYVDISKLS